jgi:hypothetical protein
MMTYESGRLEEFVARHINDTSRFFWEYYPDGNGKVIRIDGGDWIYDEAQYHLYEDENFPAIATSIYQFYKGGEFSEG